jgi:hypothetical protein
MFANTNRGKHSGDKFIVDKNILEFFTEKEERTLLDKFLITIVGTKLISGLEKSGAF